MSPVLCSAASCVYCAACTMAVQHTASQYFGSHCLNNTPGSARGCTCSMQPWQLISLVSMRCSRHTRGAVVMHFWTGAICRTWGLPSRPRSASSSHAKQHPVVWNDALHAWKACHAAQSFGVAPHASLVCHGTRAAAVLCVYLYFLWSSQLLKVWSTCSTLVQCGRFFTVLASPGSKAYSLPLLTLLHSCLPFFTLHLHDLHADMLPAFLGCLCSMPGCCLVQSFTHNP